MAMGLAPSEPVLSSFLAPQTPSPWSSCLLKSPTPSDACASCRKVLEIRKNLAISGLQQVGRENGLCLGFAIGSCAAYSSCAEAPAALYEISHLSTPHPTPCPQDRFFTELREAGDGFEVVATHFGRGVMNLTAAAIANAAASSGPNGGQASGLAGAAGGLPAAAAAVAGL